MAKKGFTKKDEYQIIYFNKRYYLTIEDNEKGKQVKVKEWSKSTVTRPATTRTILIFANHLPDLIQALTAIEKRLGTPDGKIEEEQGIDASSATA